MVQHGSNGYFNIESALGEKSTSVKQIRAHWQLDRDPSGASPCETSPIRLKFQGSVMGLPLSFSLPSAFLIERLLRQRTT
jgi:hypothetical protein